MCAADARALIELDRDECLDLLGLEAVGRLATCDPDRAPDVVPVEFVMRDGAAIFRAHAGVELERVLRAPASLEVDRFDWFHHTGWTVLVQGRAEVIDDATVEVEAWEPGEQLQLVRLVPDAVRGRRIELDPQPSEGGGYL